MESQKNRGRDRPFSSAAAIWCLFLAAILVIIAVVITAAETDGNDDDDDGSISYRLVSEIGDNLEVKDGLLVEVPPETKTVRLSVPKETGILYVKNHYGDIQYDIDANGKLEIENFSSSPYMHKNELEVGMSGRTRVAIKGEVLEYVMVFAPIQNTSAFEHVLRLPANSRVSAVVPQAEILHENGRVVVIYWKTGAVAAGDTEVFLVRFTREEETKPVEYALAAIGLVALGSIAGWLSHSAFKEYRKRRLISSLALLNEKDEKVISAVVRSGKDGILQSELLRGTQYGKSNLSKIINRLEGRGLLTKRKNGKIQRVLPGPNLPL